MRFYMYGILPLSDVSPQCCIRVLFGVNTTALHQTTLHYTGFVFLRGILFITGLIHPSCCTRLECCGATQVWMVTGDNRRAAHEVRRESPAHVHWRAYAPPNSFLWQMREAARIARIGLPPLPAPLSMNVVNRSPTSTVVCAERLGYRHDMTAVV